MKLSVYHLAGLGNVSLQTFQERRATWVTSELKTGKQWSLLSCVLIPAFLRSREEA